LQNASVSVVDLNGREMFGQEHIDAGTSDLTLNVRGWSAGVYLVRLISDGNVVVRKMVIR
jgi:hypothetical protein